MEGEGILSIAVKYLDGNKWKMFDVKDLVGHSITSFMQQSELRMVGALLEDGKPKVYICNTACDYIDYKAKGPTFSPETLRELLGSEVMPSYVAQVFPDGTFESKTLKTAQDAKGWW